MEERLERLCSRWQDELSDEAPSDERDFVNLQKALMRMRSEQELFTFVLVPEVEKEVMFLRVAFEGKRAEPVHCDAVLILQTIENVAPLPVAGREGRVRAHRLDHAKRRKRGRGHQPLIGEDLAR